MPSSDDLDVINLNPVANVQWIERHNLKPNNYNPNTMAPPERELLRTSLLQDRWTMPIVLFRDEADDTLWIVDGFHRWTVSGDEDIAELTNGYVPVVFVSGDLEHRMASTVRHNRARGVHGVLPMADIVKHLLDEGIPQDRIKQILGMEHEEVARLAERAGVPDLTQQNHKEFNPGWQPDD